MDNIAFHKNGNLIDKIQSNNTKILFIPPYSPEFNSIEYVFSSIKTKFRSFVIFPKNEEHIADAINFYKNSNFNEIYKHVKNIKE